MVQLNAFQESDKTFFLDFITANEWPFHGNCKVDADKAELSWNEGTYIGEDVRSYWIESKGERVGFVRLFDFSQEEDEIPLFDIRIASKTRKAGVGSAAINELTRIVFTELGKRRLEGYTRVDNKAMRRVFEKNLFAKEAHLRQSWPTGDGNYVDTVGYAIIKSDWLKGEVTPPDWSS